VEGRICLGNVFNGTGHYDKAIPEFQLALKSEPGSENALRGLADAYTNLGNISAAESIYKQAIALRPNYWRVYAWLGGFYFGQDRYADAAQEFLKATQLAPNNYLGYVNLAGAYILEGRYQDAIEASQHSIALRPSTDAYNNLGYAYVLMKRYPEGIIALERALKIGDGDWMNWGNLADALYWSPDRRAESVAKYRKAISIAASKLEVNPQDAFTLAYLADYSAMLDDKDAAYNYLQQALKTAPSDGEVLFRAAIVYNHFGQKKQALTYLAKAVQAGYSRKIIRDTPDFSNLQEEPAFESIASSP